MKISEALEQLQKIKDQHGDITIELCTDHAYVETEGSFISVEGFKVKTVHAYEDEEDEGEKVEIVELQFNDRFIEEHEQKEGV